MDQLPICKLQLFKIEWNQVYQQDKIEWSRVYSYRNTDSIKSWQINFAPDIPFDNNGQEIDTFDVPIYI